MLAGHEEAPDLTEDADAAVQAFVAETVGEERDVEIETAAVQGQQASAALIDAARDADLLVGGSTVRVPRDDQRVSDHAEQEQRLPRRCCARPREARLDAALVAPGLRATGARA
jgi:hypothetical protein